MPKLYLLLDQNPLYCWARIEHDWATNLPVLSLEDAIAQGMIMPE
jgi:hypothetical protein